MTGPGGSALEHDLAQLLREVRDCRICRDAPRGAPLPHEPRPVLQAGVAARLGIFSQAPGNLAHRGGRPFMDPSGIRLRQWLGLSEERFYDCERVAIVPIGFCFPGYDDKGGDLPPRRECAPQWRDRVLARLPNLELALLVGGFAQRWHLGKTAGKTLTETVRDWRSILEKNAAPQYLPLPHPSWRNTAWIRKNPWFEKDLLPALRTRIEVVLG